MTTIRKNPASGAQGQAEKTAPAKGEKQPQFVLTRSLADEYVLAISYAKDYASALKDFRDKFPAGEYIIRRVQPGMGLPHASTRVAEMFQQSREAAKENVHIEAAVVWGDALSAVSKAISLLQDKPRTSIIIQMLRTYQQRCIKTLKLLKKEIEG